MHMAFVFFVDALDYIRYRLSSASLSAAITATCHIRLLNAEVNGPFTSEGFAFIVLLWQEAFSDDNYLRLSTALPVEVQLCMQYMAQTRAVQGFRRTNTNPSVVPASFNRSALRTRGRQESKSHHQQCLIRVRTVVGCNCLCRYFGDVEIVHPKAED